MKADFKLEDSIDKIDRANLAIRADEAKLKELELNLGKARENFRYNESKREEMEKDFKTQGEKLSEIVRNHSIAFQQKNPEASAAEIKEYVSLKLTEDIGFDVLKNNIDTLKQKILIAIDVESSHKEAVSKLENAVGELRKTISRNKNQLELIESQNTASKASLEAARLSSSAEGTSTKRIEEANDVNMRINAQAKAAIDGANDNPNIRNQLDNSLQKSRIAVDSMGDDITSMIEATIIPKKLT
jgi:hypothetical protein